MDLKDYQERARQTDQSTRQAGTPDDPRTPHRHEVIPLLGLVGEVGGLLGEYKKLLRDGAIHRKFREEVAEELGDILWYVANVASKFDLSLDEVAEQNLAKVEDRWRPCGGDRILYDRDRPEEEQLPRRFEYRFEGRTINGVQKLALVDQRRGEATGDPLTDNAYEDDGYRFHDVLHLAFAACLGWSPVLRKLLRKKEQIVNRTPPEVDEVEDGGRAQVIEEAIVAAAYVYADDHDFLDGIETIDWRLLRHIKQMTSHVEVNNRSTWEWNEALLRGFAVWRELRRHDGGVVHGDLEKGTIEFSPPPARERS
jgi:NTP pyrophosphatase (non-canonical NTP hydrolase)